MLPVSHYFIEETTFSFDNIKYTLRSYE